MTTATAPRSTHPARGRRADLPKRGHFAMASARGPRRHRLVRCRSTVPPSQLSYACLDCLTTFIVVSQRSFSYEN
jgi:hypothetical protein